MLQQQYGGYGMMGGNSFMGTAMGYPQQPQPTVMNNFLSPEQISEMQHGSSQFQTRLTRDEFMRTICTHKNNNNIILQKQADGQWHCPICDKSFTVYETNTPDEVIYDICKNMHDLMQTIKTYLLNAPEDLKDIYMMLGFIEKIPMLWKTAAKTFETTFKSSQNGFNNGNNQDPFQLVGQMFGGGMPGMGMMGGYYNQQMYNQAPMNGYGMTPPMTPPPQPQQQPLTQNQPPVYGAQNYGYNQSYIMNQPNTPPSYSQPAQNPIGYVEPNQQNSGMAQTQINISPSAPNQTIPLSQDTVNPNLQTPEKVEVNKSFSPSPVA